MGVHVVFMPVNSPPIIPIYLNPGQSYAELNGPDGGASESAARNEQSRASNVASVLVVWSWAEEIELGRLAPLAMRGHLIVASSNCKVTLEGNSSVTGIMDWRTSKRIVEVLLMGSKESDEEELENRTAANRKKKEKA